MVRLLSHSDLHGRKLQRMCLRMVDHIRSVQARARRSGLKSPALLVVILVDNHEEMRRGVLMEEDECLTMKLDWMMMIEKPHFPSSLIPFRFLFSTMVSVVHEHNDK